MTWYYLLIQLNFKEVVKASLKYIRLIIFGLKISYLEIKFRVVSDINKIDFIAMKIQQEYGLFLRTEHAILRLFVIL